MLKNTFLRPRVASLVGSLALITAVGVSVTACTNTGTPASDTSSTSADTQQTVKASNGPTCSLADYHGSKIDLKDAVVGFSQSEKEDNPFRIAETKSITIDPAHVLPDRNRSNNVLTMK